MNTAHKNYPSLSRYWVAFFVSIVFLVSACTPSSSTVIPQPTFTAVPTLAPTSTSTFTPMPTPSLTFTPTFTAIPSPTPIPTDTPAPLEFSITNPIDGAEFGHNVTITISGNHTLPGDAHVWIFLKDKFGNYYIQNPPADLIPDGSWEQTNIRLGTNIQYMIAIYVNAQGNQILRDWVNEEKFGAIQESEVKSLPGYAELDRVKITTPGS